MTRIHTGDLLRCLPALAQFSAKISFLSPYSHAKQLDAVASRWAAREAKLNAPAVSSLVGELFDFDFVEFFDWLSHIVF